MSQKETSPREGSGGEPKTVICARCNRPNSLEFKTCQHCGAHLYVTCHNCGHRNERAAVRCDECGQRLHRSLLQKLWKKARRGGRHFSLGQLLLLLLCVGVAFLLIVLLNDMKIPF